MNSSLPVISRQAIARSFSAAATSYDANASLQRNVVDALLEHLAPLPVPGSVLDLGSGTGYCSARLHQQYPDAHITNLDVAEGMLGYHRAVRGGTEDSFVCADAGNLPFSDASFDLVFSSLTLQWCADPGAVFRELSRVSKPGAMILLSTLGPRTLQEVNSLWMQVDDFRHVNDFASRHDLQHELLNTDLVLKGFDTTNHTRYYADFHALAREMKGLGANNLNPGRSQSLSGRRKLRLLLEQFTAASVNGRFATGYEVFILRLKKEQ